MSECSHALNTGRPIKLVHRGFRQASLNGSPAECSRIALTQWIKEPIDLVCSGINAGGNLGVDIYYSGTVAAAREAHILGIPAIAFSMVLKDGMAPRWDMAHKGVEFNLQTWCDQRCPRELWNINFPTELHEGNLAAQLCPLETHPLCMVYHEVEDGYQYTHHHYHQRLRRSGSDVDRCFEGETTLSKLKLFV